MSNGLTLEIRDGAAVIRFCRPEVRSPLSVHVLEELSAAISAVEELGEIRGLVFTGTKGVFASGADLREVAEIDSQAAREFAMRGQKIMKRISDLRPITIAAVNGYCMGGALDLALACDRRIASRDAIFAHPGANLGIMTGWGGTQRLPKLIGQARALELFFTAKRLPATEAEKWGLVDMIVDDPAGEAIRMIGDYEPPD